MTNSDFFLLKNGQYIMSVYSSRRFEFIMEVHPELSSDYKWDEMSIAELFADAYKDDTRYCKEHKTWYAYNGHIWEKDTGGLIVAERLKEFTRLLNIYCTEISDEAIAKKYKTFIIKFTDRRARDRILKDASSVYPIFAKQFDQNPHLINCKNGTYDLKDFTFSNPSPEDFITKSTSFKFTVRTDIKFDRWDEFITEITSGDVEKANFLQRALGYSIFGIGKEECMFVAYGQTTRNGKGTLFNTIYSILGDYSKAPRVNMICKGRFDNDISKPNPALCVLQGARFVTMSEPPENAMLDEETIKSFTGGDPVTTRQLYGESFTFIPQFKMWLSCNNLPIVNDKSLFSSDRMKVIEFNRHFNEEDRDVNLKQKFLENDAIQYIFLWLVEGYKKYLKEGLEQPLALKKALANYERDNDKIGLFFEEMCEEDADAKTPAMGIYTSYKMWSKLNGYTFSGSIRFNRDFERFGKKIKPQGVTHFKGVKLKAVIR